MAIYPNTSLVEGAVDAPFGGKPANRFGMPQRQFMDSQVREAERQIIDNLWSNRPVQYTKIAEGGLAGDAVVFDTTGNAIDHNPVLRMLKNITYNTDVYPIFGILLAPVSAGAVGVVCVGGGLLPQTVTGLVSGTGGLITIDTTTGRLRIRVGAEPKNGYADLNGNCYLLPRGIGP